MHAINRFRRIDQRNMKRKPAAKREEEKNDERKREMNYKGGLAAILYVGKLDLKSKTKISPADLISVVLCRRACQNYIQTVATEEERNNPQVELERRKLWKCDTAWIRPFLGVKGLRKGEKGGGVKRRGLTR